MRALRRKRAKEGQQNGGMKKQKKFKARFYLEDQADDQLKQQA